MRLEVGRPVTIAIDPALHYSPSGIDVSPGERYDFKACGKWRDASHVCGPDGWCTWLMLPGIPFNRVRFARYFVLCGNLEKKERTNFAIRAEKTNWQPQSGSITNGETGQLFFFANDWCSMYGNNFAVRPEEGGPLAVTVTRTA